MTETPKKPATAGKKIAMAGAVQIQRARLRLDPIQERLVLDGTSAKDERVTLWLTRRLALQIFQQLRKQMEKDSPAGKTPSAWRDEALALEHAAILKSAGGKAPVKPWPGEVELQLITGVGIKPEGKVIRLVLVNGQKAVAIQPLGGVALHKFAAMLALRIQQLRWDAALDLSWLAPLPAAQKATAKKPN